MEAGSIYVTIRIPPDDFAETLSSLKLGENSLETVAIVDPTHSARGSVMVDLGSITDKQWEALRIAHSLGHYSGTRGGNLDRIADELGVSKSAASQRLRAGEARILQSILGT